MKVGFLFKKVLLKLIVLAIIVFVVVYFVLMPYRVSGNNMFPMLKSGDLCIIYKLEDSYLNDVVVYKVEDKLRIGRVVAVEGQEIDFPENGGYLVNGGSPSEEILYQTFKNADSDVKYPLTIGEGSFFIMNDFRSDQKDSRLYGEISSEDILGKVSFILRRRSF